MPALDSNPDDPDDLSFNAPSKPSELVALSDEEMFRLLRKMAFANTWPPRDVMRFEATARLIAALKDFKTSSDKAARGLFWVTVALVVLTIVLIWLTTRL